MWYMNKDLKVVRGLLHTYLGMEGFILWKHPEPGPQSRSVGNSKKARIWGTKSTSSRRAWAEGHAGHYKDSGCCSEWAGHHQRAQSRGVLWSCGERRQGGKRGGKVVVMVAEGSLTAVGGGSTEWSNRKCILKVQPTGFSAWLTVQYEREESRIFQDYNLNT